MSSMEGVTSSNSTSDYDTTLTNGTTNPPKSPSSSSSFSGGNNPESAQASSSPPSSTSASATLVDSYQDTPNIDSPHQLQTRIDNSEDSSSTNNASLQSGAPLPQPECIDEKSTRTGYVYDVRMRFHNNVHGDEDHPEDPRRIWKIFDALKTNGCISRMVKVPSREATAEELSYVHTSDYIDTITSTTSMSKETLLDVANSYNSIYLNNLSAFCARLSCGSLLELCRAVAVGQVLNGVAIVRPPGHHAEPEEAGGFCLYNNVAVAARYLQRNHGLKKIFILDWDVHHGNGTQKAFIDDPDVVYCSIHRYDDGSFYPGDPVAAAHTAVGEGAGRGRNINIPWPCSGMGDSEYIYAFNKIIMPIVYEFAPDFILVSAGFDAAKGDHIGENLVTPAAYGHMTHMLKSLAGGKIILALEGGYNLESIAVSGLACTKALLSDPIDMLDPIIPNEACVQTIHEVLEVQSKYWRSLTPMHIDHTDLRTKHCNTVELAKVLGVYRTEALYQRHKMLKLPLSNPTYAADLLDNVHTTPGMSHTKKPLYIFVHGIGEFCAKTLGANNILRPEKSVLVDCISQYLDRIVESDNELIDVAIPYEPATDNEKITVKEKVTELLTDIWDNYASVTGNNRRIVLIAAGFGCRSLVSFMNERQKDVIRLISCVVLIPDEDEILPLVTRRLSNWYMENSHVFISDDHPAWEQTNQKLINRIGNLVSSGAQFERISEQLLRLFGTVFKLIDHSLNSLSPFIEDQSKPFSTGSGMDGVSPSLAEPNSDPPVEESRQYQISYDQSMQSPGPQSPRTQQLSSGLGANSGLSAPSATGYSSSSPSSPLVDRVSLPSGNGSQRLQPYPSVNSRSQQSSSPVIVDHYDQYSGSPQQQQRMREFSQRVGSPHVYQQGQ